VSNLYRFLYHGVTRTLLGVAIVAAVAIGAGQSLAGPIDNVLISVSADLDRGARPESAAEALGLPVPAPIEIPEVPPLPSGSVFIGEPPQVPDSPGDDARLDRLWVECENGWGLSCDRLFEEAPLGSTYERFGLSCGERPGVLHCQVELDNVPLDPLTNGWPLPFPVPTYGADPDTAIGATAVSGAVTGVGD